MTASGVRVGAGYKGHDGIARVRDLDLRSLDDPRFPVTRVAVLARIEGDKVRTANALNLGTGRLRLFERFAGKRIWAFEARLAIQRDQGSFAAWLASNHPLTKAEWVKLFKKTFVFTGGEIVGEFLMSIGYLPGAHHDKCPIHKKIAKLKPAWMQAERKGFKY
jgi:hypothetical protein